MRDMIVSELARTAQEFARGFAQFLPRLIVLVIIAIVGWLIAYLLKVIARSILRLINFDRLSENAGASQLLAKAALPLPTDFVSRFVFWVAWLGFVLLGINALGILGLQEHIAHFFLFLPRLFAALFILFVGLLAASFFSRAALLGAVNADLPSPRKLSVTVRALIIVFVLSMVLEELGVAQETMLVAFGIVFGGLVLGLAIAFGNGGKELARAFLQKVFVRGTKREENEDEFSPL